VGAAACLYRPDGIPDALGGCVGSRTGALALDSQVDQLRALQRFAPPLWAHVLRVSLASCDASIRESAM
jgi:hypothetical protein